MIVFGLAHFQRVKLIGSKIRCNGVPRAGARARPFEGIAAFASPLLINLKRDADKMTVKIKIFLVKRLWLKSYP